MRNTCCDITEDGEPNRPDIDISCFMLFHVTSVGSRPSMTQLVEA